MTKELKIVGDNIIFRNYEVAKINKNQYASLIGDFIDVIKSQFKGDLLKKADELAREVEDISYSLENVAWDL